MSLSAQIFLTGVLSLFVAWPVLLAYSGKPAPSVPVMLLVLLMFFGGALAMVAGVLMGIWT